jgi:ATP-dependent DNA helicase Rep
MKELNPAQRNAVRHVQTPLLVLAGAGSGKTRVITHKIAYLVRDCGIPARAVAAVTFTNKAAREMKQRVGALLQGNELRRLKVSTFHTLGLNLVRREAERLGYKPGVSVFDAEDSRTLLRGLMRRQAKDATELVAGVQHAVSAWKNALVDPDRAASEAKDEMERIAAHWYGEYQRHLKAYNALDFDDLIRLPVRLLRSDTEAREAWQGRIRYLLVDEYQDTNGAQYELVRLLVGPRNSLTVVGDDDQSVYSWRGARPENLARLKDDYPTLEVIKLEQNYRSMGGILAAANRLIEHNPHLFDKRLWSELGTGDPLRVLTTRNEEHEAQRVVSEILHHRFKQRSRYADYAILYRGNHQARIFEQVLREHRIPYLLNGGTSFFERSEVRDLMAYLRLLVNPDDNSAFLRTVNTPRREIGPASIEKLADFAGRRDIGLLAACGEPELGRHLSRNALTRLRGFADWIVGTSAEARSEAPRRLVQRIVEDTGYAQWLGEGAKDPRAARRRLNNLDELAGWLQRLADDQGQGKQRDLAEIVSQLSLMGILERGEEDDASQDGVRLMTLHAAKGLEFPHVFLVGMEEGFLPHRTSLEDGNIEEERRLAYVGVTRAQRTLTFSLAATRRRYGECVRCTPSRFLDELADETLVWEGRQSKADPEQRQQRGKAHLANLRGMLQEIA